MGPFKCITKYSSSHCFTIHICFAALLSRFLFRRKKIMKMPVPIDLSSDTYALTLHLIFILKLSAMYAAQRKHPPFFIKNSPQHF